MTTKKYTLVS